MSPPVWLSGFRVVVWVRVLSGGLGGLVRVVPGVAYVGGIPGGCAMETELAEVKALKRKGRRFTDDEKAELRAAGVNLGGRPPKPRRVEVPGEGRLRAMRFVMANGAEFDSTGEERIMRSWLERKPKEFLEELDRLEGDRGEAGEDGIEALIAKLLREGVGGE